MSKVCPVRLIPQAIEVLHEVLYYSLPFQPGVRSTPPVLLPSNRDTQWPDRGVRKTRKTIFTTVLLYPPCLTLSLIFAGRSFVSSIFLFIVIKGPGFASHCFTSDILLFGSVYLLDLRSCCGQQRIKQKTREAWNQSVLANFFFFSRQRIVFTWCSPCMSSAAILFCIYHKMLQSFNSFLSNFNHFISELMNSR